MPSHFSCVYSCVTLWTVACQAPLSIGFSRQEYWSGFPCPAPGDLPDPGIELLSPALQADSLPLVPPGKPTHSINKSNRIKKIAEIGYPRTKNYKLLCYLLMYYWLFHNLLIERVSL